ncbi:MAG: DNA repair protein RadA, partial [Candidatus Saccharimonas sp.]
MARARTMFVCQQCGARSPKWTGKCEQCGQWNSLVEQAPAPVGKSAVARSAGQGTLLQPRPITAASQDEPAARLATGIADLDAVLGGGILPGGVLLLAGQPGMGKSTLLLQVAHAVARQQAVLYISGEESAGQVALRATRLGADQHEALSFAASTSADDIAATIRTSQYQLVIVDSIQTLSLAEITSAPGTVSQITNASNVIIQ